MAAIVAPAGDCSMAMTRDCFEPGSAFLPLGSTVPGCGAFAAVPAAYGATERFLTDFDIKILRSVHGGVAPPPPKPHLGHQAGGAGSQSALGTRELTTVPLCWRSNASPFWITLLLSSGHWSMVCTACGALLEHPLRFQWDERFQGDETSDDFGAVTAVATPVRRREFRARESLACLWRQNLLLRPACEG